MIDYLELGVADIVDRYLEWGGLDGGGHGVE